MRKSQGYLITMAFRRARSQSTRAMDLAESRFVDEAEVWGRLDTEALERLDIKPTRLIDAALYPDGSVALVPRDNSEGHPWTAEYQPDINAIAASLRRTAATPEGVAV